MTFLPFLRWVRDSPPCNPPTFLLDEGNPLRHSLRSDQIHFSLLKRVACWFQVSLFLISRLSSVLPIEGYLSSVLSMTPTLRQHTDKMYRHTTMTNPFFPTCSNNRKRSSSLPKYFPPVHHDPLPPPNPPPPPPPPVNPLRGNDRYLRPLQAAPRLPRPPPLPRSFPFPSSRRSPGPYNQEV